MLAGITRQASELNNLLANTINKNVEIVALPLTSSNKIPFDWKSIEFADNTDWLFFTSANGVISFFSQIENPESLPSTIKIAVVGEKTALALKKYDKQPQFTPQTTNAKSLFTEFAEKFAGEKLSLAYSRAKEVTFDPEDFLTSNGCEFHSLICYETKEEKISIEIIDRFNANDYILFTAPSTVRSFQNQFGKPKMGVIAIGKTTASEMDKFLWENYKIMDKPDINRIWEYI